MELKRIDTVFCTRVETKEEDVAKIHLKWPFTVHGFWLVTFDCQ